MRAQSECKKRFYGGGDWTDNLLRYAISVIWDKMDESEKMSLGRPDLSEQGVLRTFWSVQPVLCNPFKEFFDCFAQPLREHVYMLGTHAR